MLFAEIISLLLAIKTPNLHKNCSQKIHLKISEKAWHAFSSIFFEKRTFSANFHFVQTKILKYHQNEFEFQS